MRVAALYLLLGLASSAGAQQVSAQESWEIVDELKASVLTRPDGASFVVNIKMPKFNVFRQLTKRAEGPIKPCAFIGVHDCQEFIFEKNSRTPFQNAIFVAPIPYFATFYSDGTQEDVDVDITESFSLEPAELAEWLQEREEDELERAGTKFRYQEIFNADKYETYWSDYLRESSIVGMERVLSSDDQKALAFLEELTKHVLRSACTGGEDWCNAFYRFRHNGNDGIAHCTVYHIGGVVSPPYECTALSYKSRGSHYLAKLLSPGDQCEGCGAGVSGLYCSFDGKVSLERASKAFVDALREPPAGFNMNDPQLQKSDYLISGRRVAQPSFIFRNWFEWSTVHTKASKSHGPTGSYINIFGSIEVTKSKTIGHEGTAYHPISTAEADTYANSILDHLRRRLSAATGSTVECSSGAG